MTTEQSVQAAVPRSSIFARYGSRGLLAILFLLGFMAGSVMSKSQKDQSRLTANELTITDDTGRVRIRMRVWENSPVLELLDENGRSRTQVEPGCLTLLDKTGRHSVEARVDEEGRSTITLHPREGASEIALTAGLGGPNDNSIRIVSQQNSIRLSTNPDGAGLSLSDTAQKSHAAIIIDNKFKPSVIVDDEDGAVGLLPGIGLSNKPLKVTE